jgi:hypothetical protein
MSMYAFMYTQTYLLFAGEIEVQGIQVTLVCLSVGVKLVPALNNGVVQILEDLEALLIAGSGTHTEMGLEHTALD